jgi:uridine kinase
MTKEAYTAHPERFQPRYHSESADFGDRPVIIGICGGTGSGKTTLTNALFDRLGAEHVSCISHDSYYNDLQHLTLEERAHVNFDHPSSLDSNLLKDHLNDLKEGNDIECPVYDFTTHSRKQDQTVQIEAKKIVLIDGILIFAEPKLLGESIDFTNTLKDIMINRN